MRKILLLGASGSIGRQSLDIIEQYPENFPFPSCLILGLTIKGQYIHIVVSMNETKIYLIAAYVPDPAKWESDLKTHKEAKK